MTSALFLTAAALTGVFALLTGCAAHVAADVSTVYVVALAGLWAAIQFRERTHR